MKCSVGISNFLEEISRFSHSVVFLYFFALIAKEGFLISPGYSLELCIQTGVSFLFSFAFCFSSFHSYLEGLLRQSFCLFVFLFHGDGLESKVIKWIPVSPSWISPELCQQLRTPCWLLPHLGHKEVSLILNFVCNYCLVFKILFYTLAYTPKV